LPLGLTICRPGTLITLSLGTVFIAQLFSVPLIQDFNWLILIFGVVLSGLAAAGAPGSVELSMFAIVFSFLGLPLEIALILLLSIDPIIDPIRTMLNVLTNSTITLFISE